MKCPGCGFDNADDSLTCQRCGLPMPGVEIELYDVTGAAPAEEGFDVDLAKRRRREIEAARSYHADEYAEKRIREEIEAGLTLRKRQARGRLVRPRNVVLTLSSLVVASGAAVFIWWATAKRLPKSEYAEGAYIFPTNIALNLSVKLENRMVDYASRRPGPVALLTVVGDGGRIYVNGAYVADAPAHEVPIPVGGCRVIVKRGNTIRVDETLDAAAGMRYTLAVGEAKVLASGSGLAGGDKGW